MFYFVFYSSFNRVLVEKNSAIIEVIYLNMSLFFIYSSFYWTFKTLKFMTWEKTKQLPKKWSFTDIFANFTKHFKSMKKKWNLFFEKKLIEI
jgi:hypothetical protein